MKYLISFEIIVWSVLSFQPIHASSRSSSPTSLQAMAQKRAQVDWNRYEKEVYENNKNFGNFLQIIKTGFYTDFKERQANVYHNKLKELFLQHLLDHSSKDTKPLKENPELLGKALLIILASNDCKDQLSLKFLAIMAPQKEAVIQSSKNLLNQIKTNFTESLESFLSVREIYRFIKEKGK